MPDRPSTTSAPSSAATRTAVPLCVDLDGTVVLTDLLAESLVALLRRNPLYVLLLPFWLLRGRARLKREIAARVRLDVTVLPYNQPLIEWLQREKQEGRAVYLVTASDESLARPVADHLTLFDGVLASDGQENLKGIQKCRKLTSRFGERGFDYAGNSAADLAVWSGARRTIVVNAPRSLAERMSLAGGDCDVRETKAGIMGPFCRSLRPHQWVKNLIIVVPLITSHQLGNVPALSTALLALLAFCLGASGVYLINDLHDLEADRRHPTKRHRPFASGQLPLVIGTLVAPLLVASAAVVAATAGGGVLVVLGLYVVLTTAYSWKLKQVALLDVFVLAGLYTLRLIAGHAATGIPYSVWLLAFSMFIFLSLALLKRFAELQSARDAGQLTLHRRGYGAGDLQIVSTLGLGAGLLSVLVLALYVNSDDVRLLYERPTLLLLICPLFLYWISRIWMSGHRGEMHDDPVVFALRDPASYVVAVATFGVLWMAT